jgi:drug/metabolite transporter (DMT)-like permease
LSYLMLAVVSALWGTSFLLIKIATNGLDPLAFTFCRLSIGALTLAALARLFGWNWPRKARAWGFLALLAVAGQAVPVFVSGVAAQMTTSADLALMMGASPIATMLIARALGMGEVWSLRAAAGLGVGLVGVIVAVGAPVDAAHYPKAELGRALGLAAAVLFSLGALISRFASRLIGPAMTATGSMAISSCLMGSVWLASAGAAGPRHVAAAPLSSLLALLTLGMANTAFGYLVYFRLVERAGATFAALNNYATPIIGLVLGALVLDEPVALSSWLGLALVIASIVVTGNAARHAVRKG